MGFQNKLKNKTEKVPVGIFDIKAVRKHSD